MKLRLFAAAASAALLAAPALADDAPTPAAAAASVDVQLTPAQREAYQLIFADIRARNWASAEARLAANPDCLLAPVARAELYLASGSPEVALDPLTRLLAEAPDLPNAPSLASLAQARGGSGGAAIPASQAFYRFSGPSRRLRAQPVSSDPIARSLGRDIQRLIVDDSPSSAEALIAGRDSEMSSEGLTELRQRIAWSYYLTGDDPNARRLASMAARGTGEWAVHAAWVEGLAAWRARDYAAASRAFATVGQRGEDSEMRAAGLYWQARADLASGQPANVQNSLRAASRFSETFYGMLAAQSLGIVPPSAGQAEAQQLSFAQVADRANARRAIALAEIGERDLAASMLRREAEIGNPRNHGVLAALAARLNLPNVQLSLSQHGPSTYSPGAAERYPAPVWRPARGWRVDQALVFAHALQESNFRPDAVSHAGARGLLQLMPGTASDIARRRGETIDAARLNVPEINIEYGQSYMEEMRDFLGGQGLLPKVIASYNAGPGAVLNWEGRLRDRGDPLLYIESIPFVETRGYVPIVLRNYWMYQRNAGQQSTSLSALAQGMWPRFPGMQGPVAVRLNGAGTRVAD